MGAARRAQTRTFLQVRLPARHTAVGMATRRKGTTADVLVDQAVRRPDTRVLRFYGILRGADERDVANLLAQLRRHYGEAPRLLQHGTDEVRFVCDIPEDRIQAAVFGALVACESSFGTPWMHFANGRLALRVEVADSAPEACKARLRKALGFAQVLADIDVADVPDRDLDALQGVLGWRERLLGRDLEWDHAATRPGRGARRPRRVSHKHPAT